MQPLVSIILPTFNREAYIMGAIESVLGQTLKRWELMVVDDGSTDGTWDLLNTMPHDNRITLLRQHNQGASLARNAGIARARGTYMTFLDSDDRYRPEHLASRVGYMRAHPEIDVIHGGFTVIGDPFVVDRLDSTKKIHVQECVLCGTIFGRSDVFVGLDGFRPMYSEDADLVERAKSGFSVARVEIPTYRYDRTTPSSVTALALQKAGAAL